MKLERAEILGCGIEWCILNAQKVWNSNKFKKMKCLCNMSFRLKPSYFEGDGPVCTRSASSFCRNPLNFLAHGIWVIL